MIDPQVEKKIAFLKYRDDYARLNAAEALGKIGDTAAVPALIEALQDSNSIVSREAALALGIIGDVSAVPALNGILNHKAPSVRESAVKALGKIGGSRVVPALIEALKDPHFLIRIHAAVALGEIGESSAISALFIALNEQKDQVSRLAIRELWKIGNTNSKRAGIEALMDKDNEVRRYIADALIKIGVPAIPVLIMALKDKNYDARTNSARALGEIGDASAVLVLIDALSDEDHLVCKQAAASLAMMGDSVTLPRKIVALASYTALERINLLEALRCVHYKDDCLTLSYSFTDTLALCKRVLNEKDVGARAGARQVIDSLILLRPSRLNNGEEELLRAVEGAWLETHPETLLRASDEPGKER